MIPVPGKVYTFAQMLKLDLDDSPHLGFEKNGARQVIQCGHVTSDELLSVPGFAESTWRYSHTTDEWIPVFEFVGSEADIDKLVDYREVDGEFADFFPEGMLYVCPKNFPR